MLDPKLLRENTAEVANRLAKRGFNFDVATFEHLENQRKTLQVRAQELQNKRNVSSKAIGEAKAKGLDIVPMREEVNQLGEELKQVEVALALVQQQLHDFCAGLPNLPHPSVPEGLTEEENVEVRVGGTPPVFSFTPKDHVDLGAKNKGMNFEVAAKLTGSRFVVLQGQLARLQRALAQFMLDIHTQEHGYTEVYVPYIVNKHSLFGTGQLPKFAEDLFALDTDQGYYLIPTAEVSVTNFVRDEIVPASSLPLKFVCHSTCFRSEAGSYGRDMRGMIRQHQFEKVELVQLVLPEQSLEALEALTGHAEVILKRLGLPYRAVEHCAGDLSPSAAKSYDLEVWLPSQQCYREISSCSNCEDYQARRMQARYRHPTTNKPELLHTLNGSGLAVGRTLVAIMENFQDEKGNIHLPEALWAYTGGVRVIGEE
ncbi:MAG: serine--tRNA ligase [Gammaproteobacteria bacterium]|nr:serine--tRNA ligase [Gammaproteobacteria bacterium]